MVMACFQLSSPGLPPVLGLRPGLRRRGLGGGGGGVLPPLRCCLREDKTSSSGEEERPESQFRKELKRRGMTPTPLTKESASSSGMYPGVAEEVDVEEELGGSSGAGRGSTKRNGVASVEYEKDLANQREKSMALNSEGLEGLVPRAKLLLRLGGTFFLGFGPLILVTIGIFSALYFYFGLSFVHDASKLNISPPPYVDPYALLEDESVSQRAPDLDWTPSQ